MRLIDADTLKEEIVEAGQRSTRYRIGEFWELNRNEIWKVIDEQPTVEGRKKGRWIDAEWLSINTGETRKVRRCSVCGCGYFNYDVSVNTVSDIPNFCPNCGADMRKES